MHALEMQLVEISCSLLMSRQLQILCCALNGCAIFNSSFHLLGTQSEPSKYFSRSFQSTGSGSDFSFGLATAPFLTVRGRGV